MNAAQKALYFRQWARVRDVLLARGMSHGDADAERHALHVKALGADKSSKHFTNEDLDRVLAAFLAIVEPDNLNAQLRQLEQPHIRHSMVLERVRFFSLCIGLRPGCESSYISTIAQQRFGEPAFERLPFEELREIEVILWRRVQKLHPKEKAAELAREAADAADERAALVSRLPAVPMAGAATAADEDVPY